MTRRSIVSLAAAVMLVTVTAAVSYGKDAVDKGTVDKGAVDAAKPACDRPCTHVSDCPKLTCQCDQGTGTDVAACDAEQTHCCLADGEACKKFCGAHHQLWTGRFGSDTPGDSAASSRADDKPAASAARCEHTCKDPGDCPTVTCACTRGKAPNVAACDSQTNCCGDASVVCEHYCKAQKDQWTGKASEDKAIVQRDRGADALDDDGPDDDDAPVLEDPNIDVE